MKKALVLTMVLAFTVIGVSAFAQGGFGGMGRGYGNGGYGGCGNCWNNGDGGYQNNLPAATVTSDADAMNLVNDYIAKNLKGYKAGEITSYDRPMGTMYKVDATDGAGNKFFFMVTPFGGVRGPIAGNAGVWGN